MKFDLQILELVCSRLCHDLISPVGAIGNGLELMEEEGDDDLMADARRLVQSSTHRASSLLQMYRCAYGNAGNQPSFGAAEAVKLAKDAIEASRIDFKAAVPVGLSWPAGFGKLLVNGILTAVEWLPRGGTLSLTANLAGEGDAAADFTITAEGQQAACSNESARLLRLDRQGIDLTAHNIQPYLTGLIAAHHSYRLEISQPVVGTAILTARRDA
ncbi:MAG TPA: histidine phosphotransferase family protein [Candidatus Binatia bacterium]|nr:histidine phosphotransferase family protein [Candidatus Binatia bacterium]